jgi:CRP/FNR family cyclic AMP-dependent transcriptional regulator
MAAADVLRASVLLRGFTETGIQILAGIGIERSFPAGTPLFVENMVADSLLLIGGGQVRLSARSGAGDDVPLGEVGAGDCLGAVSLIMQGSRLCSAVAATTVNAVEIRHADFQRLLGQKPQACLKLLMNIIADFGQRLQENRDNLRLLLGRK